MKTVMVLTALLACGGAPAKEGKKAAKPGAVTGAVVDVACAILGEAPHPGHKGCAEGGVPMGILDDQGRLWHAISGKFGSATEMLLPHVGKRVKAEGWYAEAKGERLISISTVTALDVPPASATATQPSGGAWECPHHCGGTGTKAGACPKCGLEMTKKKG